MASTSLVTQTALTTAQEMPLALHERQQVRRSIAFDRLANHEESTKVVEGLPEASVVEAALQGWKNQMQPLCEQAEAVVEQFVNQEIRGFMALTCHRMAPEVRSEFSDQVALELAALPYFMVSSAMAAARKKVSKPEDLIPFVHDWLAAPMDDLEKEGAVLTKFKELLDA